MLPITLLGGISITKLLCDHHGAPILEVDRYDQQMVILAIYNQAAVSDESTKIRDVIPVIALNCEQNYLRG